MSQVIGNDAETTAMEYLQAQGLSLVARNVHCRWGELDLIMQDQQALVFVEVKARTSERFGGGLGALTYGKQQKLRRAAQWYLARQTNPNMACRFDVVTLGLSDQSCTWIRNAF